MQTESLVNMIIKIWGILIVSQLLFGYWNILNESLCIGINNHTVYVCESKTWMWFDCLFNFFLIYFLFFPFGMRYSHTLKEIHVPSSFP